MKFLDSLSMAAGGLRERKTRTALTILGIVIGSSMIVALYASTQGQSKAIQDQLGKLGPTTIIARATGTTRLNQTTLDQIQQIDGVQTAFLMVSSDAAVTRAGVTAQESVMGIAAQDLPTLIKGLQIDQGDVYADSDLTGAFIGSDVSKVDPDNGTYVNTGDQIIVQSSTFQRGSTPQTTTRALTVTGVAAPFGSSPFVSVDGTVFVPVTTAQQLFRYNPGQYNQLIVIADSTDHVTDVQTAVQNLLGSNVRVFSGTQIAATVGSVFQTIGTILGSIAAISLIVAGVGIANTMFVSVLERITEIGTLKAIGFKAREILGVFLLEASLTGLIGGLLGCVLGVGMAFGITKVFSSFAASRQNANNGPTPQAAPAGGGGIRVGGGGGGPGGDRGFVGGPGGGGGGGPNFGNLNAHPVFTAKLFLLAIGFAVVIAVLAGLIPSRKAAKLDPVVALKRL